MRKKHNNKNKSNKDKIIYNYKDGIKVELSFEEVIKSLLETKSNKEPKDYNS